MVCSCENLCSCEEDCACCGKHSGAACHGKKTYNSLFPICKANLLNNSNKITLTSSTNTRSTGKGSSALIKVKSRKCKSSQDSIVPLLATSYKSTLNDSKPPISENEQTKIPAKKAPGMSRFNSLKQTMLKMRRRFKKLKIRKNDNSALLATQRGHESTEESSIETASSKEADFSPGKRINSLNSKSYSTENLLQYASKDENVSFLRSRSDHDIELMSRAKCLTLTFKAETDAFEKHDYNLNGEATDKNPISKTQSCLYIKDSSHSLQSCSTPLLFNLNPLCASNNKKKGNMFPEVKKCKMINLKNSEKSTDRQFNFSYKPAIFKRNFFKSRSTSNEDDRSITVPLYSGYRDELCSKQLCSYTQPLRSSIDKSKNNEFLNCEIDSQVANSEIVSNPLNENPKAPISPSRSTFHDKVEIPHPFSQKSLHCSQSHESLVSRSFLELSLNETIGLGNSDIQDHDITDVTSVNFVSSDVSDNFEIFEIGSSPVSTDSQSISSSEFVPCSYCRFVTCIPPISDSVIPYETLE